MSIFRVDKNSNYTVMNRTALNDKRLSWKAKGIIAYMLSMPDDWIFYIEELVTHSTDGEKAFRAGLKELKSYGYVKRFPIYENKKIKYWETVIYEIPHEDDLLAQNLQVGKVDVGKLHVGNEGLLSTDSLLSTNKKNIYADFVSMTLEEYQKLVSEFGEEGTKERIERLSLYKGSTGKKYKSDYLTILSWERRNGQAVNSSYVPKTNIRTHQKQNNFSYNTLSLEDY